MASNASIPRLPYKLAISFVLRLDRAKLDHSAPIRTLDLYCIRPIIFVNEFRPYHALPGPSKNEVIVTMFYNKNRLFDLNCHVLTMAMAMAMAEQIM